MNTGQHFGDHRGWHRGRRGALASFSGGDRSPLSEPVASKEPTGPPATGRTAPPPRTQMSVGGLGARSPPTCTPWLQGPGQLAVGGQFPPRRAAKRPGWEKHLTVASCRGQAAREPRELGGPLASNHGERLTFAVAPPYPQGYVP